jgi:hypothetical protein
MLDLGDHRLLHLWLNHEIGCPMKLSAIVQAIKLSFNFSILEEFEKCA